MVQKLKKTVKKKKKVIKEIDKLKNNIVLKEKKLSKINIKLASNEQKAAKRKAKKSTAYINN